MNYFQPPSLENFKLNSLSSFKTFVFSIGMLWYKAAVMCQSIIV